MVILGLVVVGFGLASTAILVGVLQQSEPRLGGVQVIAFGRELGSLDPGGFALRASILAALSVILVFVGIELVLWTLRRRRGHTLTKLSTVNAGLEARNRLLEQRSKRLENDVDELIRWHEAAVEEARKLGYEEPARRLPAKPKDLLVVPDLDPAEPSVSPRQATGPSAE